MEKKSTKTITKAFTAIILALTICCASFVTAFAATDLVVDESATYELFNSGSDDRTIPDVFMNPAADTLTNDGNDIIARMDYRGDTAFEGCVRETQLGLPFTIDGVLLSDVSLFIKAYDVDSSQGEYDLISLVDETEDVSYPLSNLIGNNEKWRDTTITIDKNLFTSGNTYHFELYVANTNYHVAATWLVGVRNVAITVCMEEAPEITYGVTYDANGPEGVVPVDANAYAASSTVGIAFAPIPAFDGYRFLGWSTDANATVPEFTADGTMSFVITGDTTLYAVWTDIPPVTYDAIFVVDEVEYRRTFEEGTIPFFDGETDIDKNDGKTYTFVGWDAYRFDDNNVLTFVDSYDLMTELPEMTDYTKFIAKYDVENSVTDTFVLYVTMKVGEIMRFDIANLVSGYEVFWGSSNTAAADVDSAGVVTAIAQGNAIVTAIVRDEHDTITKIGYITVMVIPQDEHVHSYTETVVPPTCTTEGYTEGLCSCGDSYRTDYVPAIGHDYVAGEVVEPTCKTAGFTWYICKDCGKEIKRDYTPRLGHSDCDSDNCCDCCGIEITVIFPDFCSIFRDLFESIINFIVSSFTGLGEMC